ncbi:MAG: ABC transporter ATP-binding protein [Flavobacteriales bacterium Tduv]
MEHLLIADDLHKQYGEKMALSNFDLKVPRGSIFGLLGPNGAGKTTFIRLVNQIQQPDSGRLIFDGEPLALKHIAQIGYLPEERGLYKNMQVEEQILYLARLKGMKKAKVKNKLQQWFDRLEIGHWRHKKLGSLSKGMAQKIQFIVMVLHTPKLLILDEPFSGFDPINAQLILDQILELRKEGATILLSTHHMASVEVLCDHIVLINQSRKILDGPLTSIKEQFKENCYQIRLNIHNQTLWEAFSAQYPLSKITKVGALLDFEIHFEKKSSTSVLKQLIEIGEILSFGERIPTLDDIFIRSVQKNHHDAKSMADHST